MMTDKHTPGPWFTNGTNTILSKQPASRFNQDSYMIYGEYTGFLIAESVSPENLNLIASAPDLLAWLEKAEQMAMQQYRGGDDAPLNSSWLWLSENARAAIARARGES